MEIEFKCDCGKSMKCKEELAGRRARCKGCGKGFVIPVGTIISKDSFHAESIVYVVQPLSSPTSSEMRLSPHERRRFPAEFPSN